MIIVHGYFTVFPDKRDEAFALMRNMITSTQQETGCISYDFHTSINNPNQVFLFQEWVDLDAIQAHFLTDYVQDFLRQLPEIVDGDVVTTRYEVYPVDDEQEIELELDFANEASTSTSLIDLDSFEFNEPVSAKDGGVSSGGDFDAELDVDFSKKPDVVLH